MPYISMSVALLLVKRVWDVLFLSCLLLAVAQAQKHLIRFYKPFARVKWITTEFHIFYICLKTFSPSDGGKRTIAIMMIIFRRLNIPVNRYKNNRICEFISKIYRKRKCTKRELLRYLNVASMMCVPGCTFVSYLFKLYTSVNDLHHHVY